MSQPDDVVTVFDALVRPPRNERDRTYAASTGDWRIAKSAEGLAALLVRSPAVTRAPIVTRHLRADFGARCRVREGDGESEEIVTIIECTSTDPEVVRYFLLSMSATLSSLSSPSPLQLGSAVDTLIEVFRAMSRGARTSIQGLWGELFLIAYGADPALLVDGWHVTPNDRHRISRDQLQVPSEVELVLASLQVESSAAGATITDLVDHAVARLASTGEHRFRLLTGVADALGAEWNAAGHQRYDLASARDSLRFYAADTVPTILEPIPTAVSDVRFTVDLTKVVPVETSSLTSAEGLFAASLPVR
jgi:hypothetical protein